MLRFKYEGTRPCGGCSGSVTASMLNDPRSGAQVINGIAYCSKKCREVAYSKQMELPTRPIFRLAYEMV